MSVSGYNSGSGSIYPGKDFLDYQLNLKHRHYSYINTSLIKGEVPIWDKAFVDLTRLGTLQVNGEYVYKNGVPEEIGGIKDKTSFVFNSIAEKIDSSSLALKAVDLLQQDLGGSSLMKVGFEKGFYKEIEKDEVESTHSAVAKRHYNSINTDKKNFTVIHEELVQLRSLEDLEKTSYFKVKTVVQGKIDALHARNPKGMSVSIAYTKEYSSMEEAFKADYWGTKAGGWSNTESYIKD